MEDVVVAGRTDLREYLHILNRRKLVIVLTVVVVVGLALAYSLVKTPVYSATATVLVPQQQASSALNIQNNSQLPAAPSLQRTLADEQQFARGDAVRRTAEQTLGHQANITVGASTTADVLTFTAHSTSKVGAAAIANAYAKGYISARRANQVEQFTQQITALQTSIQQLQARANALPPTSSQRAALEQTITSLSQTVQQTQAAAQVVSQTGPTVVNTADVPTAPSSPKPVRNAILGLLAGLILGIGLAFLVERLDDGINSRDAAEKAVDGLPVVGLIPMVDSWKRRGSHHVALLEDPNSMVSEAYRSLRTSVQFLSIDNPVRVIGITSSVPDEGKTTVVANLAVSFARVGQRVIIVSCDLRRPRIHQFFQLDNHTGLTSLLLDTTSGSKAIQSVPGESNLRLLSSGPVPPNPAEILSRDRVHQLIERLAANADIVLLDCPPVLPVTDAVLLSRLVDAMLIVASAKSTSVRELHRTFEMLKQVGAPVLGTILNRVPTEGGYAYSYGYGYGYYHTYSDERAPASTNGSTGSDQKTAVSGSISTPNWSEEGSPVAQDSGSTSIRVSRDDAETLDRNGEGDERESTGWPSPAPSPSSEQP